MVDGQLNSTAERAELTVLRGETEFDEHGDPLPPPQPFSGYIQKIEGRRMELSSSNQIQSGIALKIETPAALWLGIVEDCAASDSSSPAASWNIRVDLRHVLRDFETLARLAERFGMAQDPHGNS